MSTGRQKFLRLLVAMMAFSLLVWPSSSSAQSTTLDVPVGALLPLTGELESKGNMHKAAIELAVEEINEYLRQAGHRFRLDLTVYDSVSNPEEALRLAEQMRQAGTNIIIVGSSAEVAALTDWSEQHGTIVFSFSSTAPSLALADDRIYRLIPNDYHISEALAALMEREGIRFVVPLYRNDHYGQELAGLVTDELARRGVATAEPVIYEPNTTNFQPVIDTLAGRLQQSNVDPQQTGIILVAFNEAVDILALAGEAGDLAAVRWFGGDSIALSPAIVKDEQSAKTATAALLGVTFGIDDSSYYRKVKAQFEQKFGPNIIPDAYYAYDIPWLLSTVMQTMDDPADVEELHASIIPLSRYYTGASGWLMLDENGDRSLSPIDVWQVRESSSGYNWERVAMYRKDPSQPGSFVLIDEDRAEDRLDPTIPSSYEQGITRAEFVHLLVQLMNPPAMAVNAPGFADVTEQDHGDGVYRALAYAAEKQIITGYEDGRFRSQKPITRAEMAVVLQRALNLPSLDQGGVEFLDKDDIPGWAQEAAAMVVGHGIIPLTVDGRFAPVATTAPSEAMQMLFRAFKLFDEAGGLSSASLVAEQVSDDELASRLFVLLQAKDIAGLEAFLAPEFMIQRSDGTHMTKKEYVANLPMVEHFEVSGVVGRRAGNGIVRVVRYMVQASEIINGQYITKDPVPRMSVFVWNGEQWQLFAHSNFAPIPN